MRGEICGVFLFDALILTRLGGFHATPRGTGREASGHQCLRALVTGIAPSKEALREREAGVEPFTRERVAALLPGDFSLGKRALCRGRRQRRRAVEKGLREAPEKLLKNPRRRDLP